MTCPGLGFHCFALVFKDRKISRSSIHNKGNINKIIFQVKLSKLVSMKLFRLISEGSSTTLVTSSLLILSLIFSYSSTFTTKRFISPHACSFPSQPVLHIISFCSAETSLFSISNKKVEAEGKGERVDIQISTLCISLNQIKC